MYRAIQIRDTTLSLCRRLLSYGCIASGLLPTVLYAQPEFQEPVQLVQIFYGPQGTPSPSISKILRSQECQAAQPRFPVEGHMFECLISAAEEGEMEAQTVLAALYLLGMGMPMDKQKAFFWNSKAAAQGYPIAEYHLGAQYFYGEGVKRDEQQAFLWISKAADHGVIDAKTSLATMYIKARGVDRNIAKALALYTSAAEAGDAYAQYNLGLMQLRGIGVLKNFDAAHEWFSKASEQGFLNADFYLSVLYDMGYRKKIRNSRADLPIDALSVSSLTTHFFNTAQIQPNKHGQYYSSGAFPPPSRMHSWRS